MPTVKRFTFNGYEILVEAATVTIAGVQFYIGDPELSAALDLVARGEP